MKAYLGDGVYVEWNGEMLTLTVEDERGPSETIHLDQHVYSNLTRFVEQVIGGAGNTEEK